MPLGVLTKVDRIEPGTTSKWVSILKNQENALKHGWFAVKQPNPRELEEGIQWEEARANEDGFFTLNEPWASLERGHRKRLGSVALAEHLSVILSVLVSQRLVGPSITKWILLLMRLSSRLPEIQTDITRLLWQVDRKLDDLPIPNYSDPRRDIITLIRDFTKIVSKHIDGDNLVSTSSSNLSLIHRINLAYDRFRLAVHCTAPQFRPWTTSYLSSNSKSHSLEQPSSTPSSSPLQSMINAADLGNPSGVNGPVWYLDEVMDLAKRFSCFQRLSKSAHPLFTFAIV